MTPPPVPPCTFVLPLPLCTSCPQHSTPCVSATPIGRLHACALQSEATFEVPDGLEPCGTIFIEAATQAYMYLSDYYQTNDVAAIAIVRLPGRNRQQVLRSSMRIVHRYHSLPLCCFLGLPLSGPAPHARTIEPARRPCDSGQHIYYCG